MIHPIPCLGISLKGEFGKHGTWSNEELERFPTECQKRNTAFGTFWKLLPSLFLSLSMIKSNWILEWQLDWPPLNDPIESSHFLHDFLLIVLLMDSQTKGICSPSLSTYLLSLIFQTLLICPGLLSEKLLTLKRFTLGNGMHPCFQPSSPPYNFQDCVCMRAHLSFLSCFLILSSPQ